MKRNRSALIVVWCVALYPYLVGFTPDSTGTSSLEIIFGYGYGATSRYAGSCFGDYYGVASQPYTEAGAEVVYRKDELIAGVQSGYYTAEGASHTYYDEIGYKTRIYDPIKSFYAAPFIGADFGTIEGRVGVLYVNTAKPNHLFTKGKRGGYPSIYTRIGNKQKGIFFTFSYMSAVPLIGGGGSWNTGFGSIINAPGTPEIWMGLIKQDRENTAIGLKITSFEIFNTRIGAIISMPFIGMIAHERTGQMPYSIALTMSTVFNL